jgi:beta-ketoacyl synthase-like protein
MRIHIASVGVLAPGLTGWDESRRAAAGEIEVVPIPFTPPAPMCLPAAERRRTGVTARLAIAVAEQALEGAAIPAAEMAMVFAAAEAAGDITHQLCEALAGTREVSPTVFHNSVHNAPLGYLSIALGAKGSGTSICRGEWTFAAALMHAALEAQSSGRPVLLVCYDSPFPHPLRDAHPVVEATALALVLTPHAGVRTLATCELSISAGEAIDAWPAWIPAAWRANASARGFAALSAWATPNAAAVRIPCAPGYGMEVRAHG